VGQIGLPFSESGSIQILGFSLPLQADSTIIASATPALSLGGSLNVKVVEIAPDSNKAASQADALNLLLIMARGIAAPLADNPANNGLKELLRTAEITRKHDRVVITATVSPSIFAASSGREISPQESPSSSGASK
jgi:hypothetical protein